MEKLEKRRTDMKRPAPPITERTGDYWRSGADGILRIARCQSCNWYLHPPKPICGKCWGRDIQFEPVSGNGTVYTLTVNRYQWNPGMPPPYVIAEVELPEQVGLRITSNIIGCEIDAVKIGLSVTVTFDHVGETWIPVFTA
jgi:uncharacterized OB-fold protein